MLFLIPGKFFAILSWIDSIAEKQYLLLLLMLMRLKWLVDFDFAVDSASDCCYRGCY